MLHIIACQRHADYVQYRRRALSDPLRAGQTGDNARALAGVLGQRGIDTLLITGTTTNTCCESTARDAAMLDFRVVMVSDGNAAWSDEEHATTLTGFQIVFGEAMTTDEAIARLAGAAQRKTA